MSKLTLLSVLGFPVILTLGYGCLFLFSRQNARLLVGPVGFALYPALLSVPLAAVLTTHWDRITEALTFHRDQLIWVPLGLLAGLLLWVVQLRILPGRTPDASERIWVGPAGRIGFALLMLPVAYIVFAEEVIWRAYLLPELGLALSAGAFAIHHYHFGLRHVVFSFLAGLAFGGLYRGAGELWTPIVSHFVYNALAWRHMRLSAMRRDM